MATPIPQNDAAFDLEDILGATGGRVMGALGERYLGLSGVGTDTRRLRRGEIFVALKGAQHDGHRYLEAAAEAKAGLALVEREVPRPEGGMTLVRVDDTWRALRQLASHHLERWRRHHQGRVLAVTGSAGKTTTKAAIGAILDEVVPRLSHVTPGNLNNLVGVPMTIFGLGASHRYAVLEMGTNQKGEIPTLARLGRPDVAMVTLISAAHTEGLGGIDGVEQEKLAMFTEAPRMAVRIGNADDARVRAGLSSYGLRGLGYGTHASASYRIDSRHLDGTLQRTELSVLDRHLSVAAPLFGAVGSLAVAAAVAGAEALLERRLGADEVEVGLSRFEAGRRFRLLEAGALKIVDDTYNANPASCAASLATAAELAAADDRRLLVVLGEMRELGAESLEAHRELGARAAEHGADVIAIGGDARHLADAARAAGARALFVEEAAEAIALLRERLSPPQDFLVLVKASRSIRAERVVDALVGDAS